ncbi:hypothetical protein R3W88_024482 [Solanum pinnatisectum]|uniref:Uncharacterized protein n=1 Tax=Solanum pinnatisectum TaxID=50273 RepID=A0AAV9M3Q2_9SOLN|nr:hypothetical protein R3W88_024482 [Solanum pinnatisectum]
MRFPDDELVDGFLRAKLSSIWEGFDKVGTKSIVIHGKTFAKPELKSCIEEFEEKLNKFDIERKEQELTAKNAQSHQQKVDILDNITVTEKEEEEISESEINGHKVHTCNVKRRDDEYRRRKAVEAANKNKTKTTQGNDTHAKVYGSDLGLC